MRKEIFPLEDFSLGQRAGRANSTQRLIELQWGIVEFTPSEETTNQFSKPNLDEFSSEEY